jgi:hypothetical protein
LVKKPCLIERLLCHAIGRRFPQSAHMRYIVQHYNASVTGWRFRDLCIDPELDSPLELMGAQSVLTHSH